MKGLSKYRVPLFWALCQLVTVYIIFFVFFRPSNHYSYSRQNIEIKRKIDQIVNVCGPSYFVSWIVFNETGLAHKYFFQDVIGCSQSPLTPKTCAYSVKDLRVNPLYDRVINLVDKKTRDLFRDMRNKQAYYYDREGVARLLSYPTIRLVMGNMNNSIQSIAMGVIKRHNELVYLFTVINISEHIVCDKEKIVELLGEVTMVAGNQA